MKSSNYFRHDFGARNDPKLKRARRVKGLAAIGLYWDLVEILNEEGGYLPLSQLEDIAYDEHLEDVSILEWLINESELFENDGEVFWSQRQLEDQQKRKDISEKRKNIGASGGEAKAQKQAIGGFDSTKTLPIGKQDSTKSLPIATANIKDKSLNNLNISGDSISIESLSDSEPEIRLEDGDSSVKPHSPVDNSWVRDMFNSICVDFPRVTSLSDKRKNKIRLRLEEMNKEGPQKEVLTTVFTKMQASKFMKGDNHSGWKASFDWVFENPTNWVKIYEGNYDDKARSPADAKTDRVTGLSKNINDYWDRKSNGSTD